MYNTHINACIVITGCIQQSDAVHYTSDWMLLQSQTLGPFTIDHGLGEYPAKVDVQINVTKNGNQFIFSGIGTAQRDDDRDKMYGGVVYTYNDKHVKLYVPKSTDTASYTDKGRLVFTGKSRICSFQIMNLDGWHHFVFL